MYWEKSATSVLTALCYAIIEDAPCEEQVHLYSIYTMWGILMNTYKAYKLRIYPTGYKEN